MSGSVVAQTAPRFPGDTKIFIQSRFILWDQHEKMIDDDFNITIITLDNLTHNYNIRIDDINYNGSYNYSALIEIHYNHSSINQLIIIIDGNKSLEAYDIIVSDQMKGGIISDLIETIKIEFLPVELTRFEWNLVFSGIVGACICLPTAYYTVKYYRKYRGAKEV